MSASLRYLAPFATVLALLGCAPDSTDTTKSAQPVPSCAADEYKTPSAGCCPIGWIVDGQGECVAPGVPADACPAGFVANDAYGCDVILPAQACPAGQIALPGDTACRPLSECGSPPYGDYEFEPSTVYVDGFYKGQSDGSALKPFTSINDAIAAATPGAIVAVAMGLYKEKVLIEGKAIRLWGRCPSKVKIRLVSGEVQAVLVGVDSAGSELKGLDVSGLGYGIGVDAAPDLLIEQVWVHDTTQHALAVVDVHGPSSVRLNRVLLEHSGGNLLIQGSQALIEDSVFRGALNGTSAGRGVQVVSTTSPQRSSVVTIRRSVIEDNLGLGVLVAGSELTLEDSVVRNNRSFQGTGGDGIVAQDRTIENSKSVQRSTLLVSGSLVEGN